MYAVLNCLSSWFLYLAALSGIAAFAYNYTGWFAYWLLLCVLFLPLLSLILTLPTALGTRLYLSCPETAERGNTVYVLLRAEGVRFLCPFPVTVELSQECISAAEPKLRRVRDRMLPESSPKMEGTAETGTVGTAKQKKRILSQKRFSAKEDRALSRARITVDTAHTGITRTTLVRASVMDFFGLFAFRVRVVGSRSCDTLVLPGKAVLTGIPDPWKRNGGVLVAAQGFSEQQEIRGYRPGDAMRSVHWKLSAKTDDVLVREGVEPERKRLGLTFDRTPDPTAADIVYDYTDALARRLLDDARTAYLHVLWCCADGGTDGFYLRRAEELPDLYRKLFSVRTPKEPTSGADIVRDAALRDVDAGYHVAAVPDGVQIALTLSRAGAFRTEQDFNETELRLPIS